MDLQLSIGDHLLTDYNGYDLHAMYAGDGQVLSFQHHGWGFCPLALLPLEDFIYTDLRVRQYHQPAYDGPTALQRALSRLGEEVEVDRGEIYAWAITGDSTSDDQEVVSICVKPKDS